MKFTVAWAETLTKNATLKVAVVSLSVVTLGLTLTTVKLARREPLIIERACFSKVQPQASTARTDTEIEAFTREMIHQRFDSGASVTSGYLSPEEEAFRKQEQEGLKSSNMTQKVIVNSLKIEKEIITVDADRLISVDRVRSAFSFPISVTLSSVPRNEGNPYGLIAGQVSPIKKEEEIKK